MCRFSDAGNDELSTRSGGRRPKSAKARNRGRYARSAVPLAQLWGFERRTCRVRACARREVDLIAQGTACWRACAERCEARKARIERLFVGREKNLCELTRAHLSGDDKDDRHCGMAIGWT